jgi:acetyltransferase-like isoleucine patch superfamily enzyme
MPVNIIRCGEVIMGQGAVIDDNVTLGHRADGKLVIGNNARIRSGSIIYSDVTIGDNFKTGHNVLIRENTRIGDNTLIGTNTVIDGNCVIGSHVSVQTGVYITVNTTIEDNVFMGPCSVTTNDKQMVQGADLKGPTIKKGARIGANAVILPGVIIGENAVVGAGSVVTRDAPAGKTVAGNPARLMKSGER